MALSAHNWGRRGLIALGLMGTAVTAQGAVNVRDAILCEAHTRLVSWYGGQGQGGLTPHLGEPKDRDGVELQITQDGVPCGGDKVIVTFGKFDSEVEPEDLFQALTDVQNQMQWDSMVKSVTVLGDFPEQQARGVAMSFGASPFSTREIFQWQIVNTSDPNDFWAASTSESNDLLKSTKALDSGNVEIQNCLGAYRVQRRPQGGSHVTFTSHVNAHPFLVSSEFIFEVMWGKTVDYVKSLQARGQALATARTKQTPPAPSPTFPAWMLDGAKDPDFSTTNKVAIPFSSCAAPGAPAVVTIQDWALESSEALPSEFSTGLMAGLRAMIVAGGLVTGVALALRSWSCHARKGQDQESQGEALMDCHDPEAPQ